MPPLKILSALALLCLPTLAAAAAPICPQRPQGDDGWPAFWAQFQPATPGAGQIRFKANSPHHLERHPNPACGRRIVLDAATTLHTAQGQLALPAGAHVWHDGRGLRVGLPPGVTDGLIWNGLPVEAGIRLWLGRNAKALTLGEADPDAHIAQLTLKPGARYLAHGLAWAGRIDFQRPGTAVGCGALAEPTTIQGVELPAGAQLCGHNQDRRLGLTATLPAADAAPRTFHTWIADGVTGAHATHTEGAPAATLTVWTPTERHTWTGARLFMDLKSDRARLELAQIQGPEARITLESAQRRPARLHVEYETPRALDGRRCEHVHWEWTPTRRAATCMDTARAGGHALKTAPPFAP